MKKFYNGVEMSDNLTACWREGLADFWKGLQTVVTTSLGHSAMAWNPWISRLCHIRINL